MKQREPDPLDPFGPKGAYHFWLHQSRSDHQPYRELLDGTYREAWDRRGLYRRASVLLFIALTGKLEAVDLVWKGLRSRANHVRTSASAALYSLASDGLVLAEAQAVFLFKVVKSTDNSVAAICLLALERLEVAGLDSLLRELGASPDPGVRVNANLRLVERGDEQAAARLLADLPNIEFWWRRHYAELLWNGRARARLSAAELESVRMVLVEHMDELRADARAGDVWNRTVDAVRLFAVPVKRWGLPFEPSDIALLGNAVLAPDGKDAAWQAKSRLEGVALLGWLDREDARAWLYKIAASDLPDDVRDAALAYLQPPEWPDTPGGWTCFRRRLKAVA